VALVTDGRMSGASGKVLSAIQVTPESSAGGLIGKIRDGDVVTIDSASGTLSVDAPDIDTRPGLEADVVNRQVGMGRELFAVFREYSQGAEQGAGIFTVADA
jgi:phosphogluconate dehydratase